MNGTGLPSTLEAMTGDFLPRRRQASVRAQLSVAVLLFAAAGIGLYLFL